MAHTVLSDGYVTRWNCNYYDLSNKRWIFGILHLLPSALFFEAKSVNPQNNPDNPLELYLKFTIISLVNKASSSFVYPSITVKVSINKTYWFSSFHDRNGVYLVIQKFLHSFLLNVNEEGKIKSQSQEKQTFHLSSQIGKTLLHDVEEAHQTLQSATTRLSFQGRQLTNASITMDTINADLSMATRITKGISLWFGRWHVPTVLKSDVIQVVENKDIPYGFYFEALCSEIIGLKYEPRVECVLRLMTDGITIMDTKQKTIHHFRWRDVSRLLVNTPWEITLSRYLIGQNDISFSLTAVEMPSLLREVKKFIPDKIEVINQWIQDETDSDCGFPLTRSRNPQNLSGLSSSSPASDNSSNLPLIDLSFHDNSSDTQCQITTEQGPTDREVEEISSVLSNLKSLALDVQVEEDKQLKNLDQLTDSVNRGNDKLGNLNRKIKTLLR